MLLGAGVERRQAAPRPHPRSEAHSYAATHVAAGTDLFVIGKLLGHRDPKTSARYAHLAKEVAQSAVDRAAGVLS